MKNHEWVDGKLLQTNKKYSHLKQKQKEKIYQWMYEAYRSKNEELKKYPDQRDDDKILFSVMEKIEQAEIWIPYNEIEKHYRSIRQNLRKRLTRELIKQKIEQVPIALQVMEGNFSVCKIEDYSDVDLSKPFCFTAVTDEEKSLVCLTDTVPEETISRVDGWRCFRICGELDFSLIGILARISKILAQNEIGIFVVSTFNTDYIFTKDEDFEKAISVLKNSGYKVRG